MGTYPIPQGLSVMLSDDLAGGDPEMRGCVCIWLTSLSDRP